MKTTLDLPDELMRAVKVRAAEDNLELKEVLTNLLRRGLAATAAKKSMLRNRVQFPLVKCTRPARPGDELTPERVGELLGEADISDLGVAQ
jgi:plasmid stability protein